MSEIIRPVPGGWLVEIDAEDAAEMAGNVDLLADLLGRAESAGSGADLRPGLDIETLTDLEGHGEDGEGAWDEGQDAVLKALDFEPQATMAEPANPILAALFRPLSLDEQAAGELRALTWGPLCQVKRQNYSVVSAALHGAAQSGAPVYIAQEHLGAWLATLNDMRLSLTVPLQIKDDARADEVFEIASLYFHGAAPESGAFDHLLCCQDGAGLAGGGAAGGGAADSDLTNAEVAPALDRATEIALACSYSVIAWWQEALLEAARG